MQKHVLFLLCLFLFFSCSEGTPKEEKGKQPTVAQEIETEFAQHFSLKSVEGGYALTFIDPNTHKTEATYQLLKRGTPEAKNAIPIPCKNIASLSQTVVGMLDALNATHFLRGISNANYIYSNTIKEAFTDGKIHELGSTSTISVEGVVASKSKLIIYDGFGTPFPHAEKLRTLNIQTIPNYDWRETHPLGKAEWIKLIGILCGKEKEANDYFTKVKESYEALRREASQLATSPTVLSGHIFGDVWNAPAGESYMAHLMKDAHAQYVYAHSKGTGSLQLPMEQIIKDNQSTEYWLNPGLATKQKILESMPKARYIPAFKNSTYCYSVNINKYWEQSAIHPDWVLSDLLRVLHQQEGGTLMFYNRIEE